MILQSYRYSILVIFKNKIYVKFCIIQEIEKNTTTEKKFETNRKCRRVSYWVHCQ